MRQQTTISTRSVNQTWLLASVTEYFTEMGEHDYAHCNWAITPWSWLDKILPSPKFEFRLVYGWR